MSPSIETKATEKKGTQPLFGTTESPARELYLLLQHVSGVFEQELSLALRPAGITPAQYHVLRILRSAGPALHAKQLGGVPARQLAAVRKMLVAVGGARPA